MATRPYTIWLLLPSSLFLLLPHLLSFSDVTSCSLLNMPASLLPNLLCTFGLPYLHSYQHHLQVIALEAQPHEPHPNRSHSPLLFVSL